MAASDHKEKTEPRLIIQVVYIFFNEFCAEAGQEGELTEIPTQAQHPPLNGFSVNCCLRKNERDS